MADAHAAVLPPGPDEHMGLGPCTPMVGRSSAKSCEVVAQPESAAMRKRLASRRMDNPCLVVAAIFGQNMEAVCRISPTLRPKEKARTGVRAFEKLVAGVGFEPTTFGL